MIFVDASVWIDFFSATPTAEAVWLRDCGLSQEIALADLTLCEILMGMRSDKRANEFLRTMRHIPLVPVSNPELSIKAAANYRYLRSLGITIRSTVDLILATYCIEHRHILLHRDRDFSAFEKHLGLKALHAS